MIAGFDSGSDLEVHGGRALIVLLEGVVLAGQDGVVSLSGLAVASIVGILLNAILPGNDYEFDSADGADAPSSGNLQV